MLSIKKFGAATLVSGCVFLLDPGSAEAVTIKLDGIGEEAPEPLSDEVASQVNPADIKGYILPRMLKVYPQLKDVRIDFQWGAMIGIVPNRIPVVGRIDDKGPRTASSLSLTTCDQANWDGRVRQPPDSHRAWSSTSRRINSFDQSERFCEKS